MTLHQQIQALQDEGYWVSGITQQEIADVVGIHANRVGQIHNQNFRDFSKTLEEMLSKGFTIPEK